MEQMNYEKLIPTEPAKNMMHWLINTGHFTDEYIVYKSAWVRNPLSGIKERMVHCICSCCQNEWYAQRADWKGCHCAQPSAPFGFVNPVRRDSVIDGQKTQCPYCDTDAEVVHIGKIRDTRVVDEIYPMSIEKISKFNVALIVWRIVRALHKNGCIVFEKYPYEAYVCEERKLVRLTAYTSGPYNIRTCTDRWNQRKRFDDTWGTHPKELIYPFNADSLIGTVLENSKLDIYLKCDEALCPVSYCNLFIKHKNVENLIMQGMSKYVNDKLIKLGSYYVKGLGSIKQIKDVDWKEKKPHKMLGLTKDEFKIAKKCKWTDGDVKFYLSVKSAGIRPENVAKCQEYGYSAVVEFIDEFPSENVMKVIRYLDRQRKKISQTEKSRYIRSSGLLEHVRTAG